MNPGSPPSITQLENYEHINVFDKVAILLAMGDLKPAAMFYVESEPYDAFDAPKHVPEEIINDISVLMQSLGLFCEVYAWTTKNSDENEKNYEYVTFFISKHAEKARRLKALIQQHRVETSYEEGILLGYPETAVEAFAHGGELLEVTARNIENFNEAYIRLLGFRLSKKHWREEVKILESYGDYLLNVSPAVYKAAMLY